MFQSPEQPGPQKRLLRPRVRTAGPFSLSQHRTPISGTKARWSHFFKDAEVTTVKQYARDTRLNLSMESRKFNYSLISNETFEMDASQTQKRPMTTAGAGRLPSKPHRQLCTAYASQWLTASQKRRCTLFRPHRTIRPVSTPGKLRLEPKAQLMTRMHGRIGSEVAQRDVKTAAVKMRRLDTATETKDVKAVLKRLRTGSHYDFLNADLKKHGFDTTASISEVLKALTGTRDDGSENGSASGAGGEGEYGAPAKEEPQIIHMRKTNLPENSNQTSGMSSIKEFFGGEGLVVALPLAHDEQQEEKGMIKLQLVKQDIVDHCENIQQRMDAEKASVLANTGKMSPQDSKYLQLLEKQYGLRPETIARQVDHTLSRCLYGNMYTALKKEVVLKDEDKLTILSSDELAVVREQLASSASPTFSREADMDYVEQLLRKIKFFEGLSRTQRIRVLRQATFRSFRKDEILVEGQTIQDIYIVLHGSVIVFSNTRDFTKRLMDGELFGEELFVESEFNPTGVTKYSYSKFTMKAREDADVLVLPRQDFANIVYKDMKDELYHKLYTLKSCALFAYVPVIELVPFAAKLKFEMKHYCEIIVRQSQSPPCCCIVASGVCKVLFELITKGSLTPSKYARRSQQKPERALWFGTTSFHSKGTSKAAKGRMPQTGKSRALNFSYENQVVSKAANGDVEYKTHVYSQDKIRYDRYHSDDWNWGNVSAADCC